MRLEKKGLVWHAPQSRTYHLVAPLSVPQERALLRLRRSGIAIEASTLLDLEKLQHVLSAPDERSAASAIDRLRESGVLVPAGKGRWKLGQSILEYARMRAASEG